VAPPRTALVVIDMQNAFCSARGSYRRRGRSIRGMKTLLANVRKLLAFARREKMPVVFTRLSFKRDYSDAGPLVRKQPGIAAVKAYGGWDGAIEKSLRPRRGETVVVKKRYDAFVGTGLEGLLRRKGVGRVVVAGVLTNVCVESLVRSAFDRGFAPLVAADATATYSKRLHAASLETLKRHFAEVLSCSELCGT